MTILLNIYSFGYSAGFLKERGVSDSNKLTLSHALELSRLAGLDGIEFPADYFFSLNNINQLPKFLDSLKNNHQKFFIDLEKLDLAYVNTIVPILKDYGQNSMRIKMEHLGPVFYGGNRFSSLHFGKSFENFKEILKKSLPLLKKHSFKLLIENHQDISGHELKGIIEEISPEHLGVNWDIGNSASVADTPDSFFRKCGKYIGHVHLKDYKIFKTQNGYKLTRCPLGHGFVDFNHCFNLLSSLDVTSSIELGAQVSRECFSNNPEYWTELVAQGYSPDVFHDFVLKHLSNSYPQSSIWESGAQEAEILESERIEFMQSASHIKGIV